MKNIRNSRNQNIDTKEKRFSNSKYQDDYATSTVLLISDNDFTILSLKYLLETKNIFVLTAPNSGVASHLLENFKIDSVIIDYNVSESFCLDVLKSTTPLFSSTTIIVHSGSKQIVTEEKFLKAGATCLVNINDKESLLKAILI